MSDAVQSQIAELRRKLDSLDTLRSELGEELYQRKKADLEAQLRPLIETAGGAFVSGSVNVGSGKFVGRDDYSTTIITNPDRYPPEELLACYYRALAADCCRLPLGIIDTQFIRTKGESPLAAADRAQHQTTTGTFQAL